MEVVKKLWKLCIRNISPEICLHNLTGLLYHLGEVLSNSKVWNEKNKILCTYRFPGDPKYSLTKSEFSNGKGIFWCNDVLEMISTNSSKMQMINLWVEFLVNVPSTRIKPNFSCTYHNSHFHCHWCRKAEKLFCKVHLVYKVVLQTLQTRWMI